MSLTAFLSEKLLELSNFFIQLPLNFLYIKMCGENFKDNFLIKFITIYFFIILLSRGEN